MRVYGNRKILAKIVDEATWDGPRGHMCIYQNGGALLVEFREAERFEAHITQAHVDNLQGFDSIAPASDSRMMYLDQGAAWQALAGRRDESHILSISGCIWPAAHLDEHPDPEHCLWLAAGLDGPQQQHTASQATQLRRHLPDLYCVSQM